MIKRLGAAVLGAVVIAAVSTLGDYIWFGFRLRHRAIYGLAHGTLLFLAIGAYLGAVARAPSYGAAAGGAIGLIAAGSYYVLEPFTGPAIMFILWMAIWFALAALVDRLGPASIESSLSPAIIRGLVAAVASGLAFYAISGIWTETAPQGRNYFKHFLSWTVAYLPAFLVLLVRRRAA